MSELEKKETLGNTIENTYQNCKDFIIGYFRNPSDSRVTEKLSAAQNNLKNNDKLQNKEKKKEEINTKLENLKTLTEIPEISTYLDNAKIVYGKIEGEQKMGSGLTINILDDKDYSNENSGSFGCYDPFTETISLPKSVDESTMLHEVIHALTFKFNTFFYNQIGMDSGKLKQIQKHIYNNNDDVMEYEKLSGKVDEIKYKTLKFNYENQKSMINLGKEFSSKLATRVSMDEFNIVGKNPDSEIDNLISKFELENITDEEKNKLIEKRKETNTDRYKELIDNELRMVKHISEVKKNIEELQNKKNIFNNKKTEEDIESKKKYLNELLNILANSKETYLFDFLGRKELNILRSVAKEGKDMSSEEIILKYKELSNSVADINTGNGGGSQRNELIDIISEIKMKKHNKELEKIDHDLKILNMLNLDPGMGYMGSFEIVARIWQMRADLVKEKIIKNIGDKITIEDIEKLMKIKGAYYKNNKSYNLLDNIELDKNEKIQEKDKEFIELIIGMNNDEVVNTGDGKKYGNIS